MKYKPHLIILAALLTCGYPSGDAASPDYPKTQLTQGSVPLESVALNQSLAQLHKRHYSPYTQGVLVETLDGRVLAEWNSDSPFNPASVLKLATSFFALSRLGPDYQFRTSVYGDQKVNQSLKELDGNLTIVSDGDPVFMTADASAMVRTLLQKGIRKVNGDLLFMGPFTMPVVGEITPQRSAEGLRKEFRKVGIQLKGQVRLIQQDPSVLQGQFHFLTRYSPRLIDILWVQNAHSVNQIADRLGEAAGGVEALRQFVLDTTHVDPPDFFVSKPSGLEHNQMTPHAAVLMLRALNNWLEAHHLRMQDIMPVAGLDEGTLASRFRNPSLCGGILGKTGTNPAKDGGISALAGMAYTRDQGPIFYAIFNTHGSVYAYRRWQDKLLQGIIEENGGVSQFLSGKSELVNIYARQQWLPSDYWSSLNQVVSVYNPPASSKSKKPATVAKKTNPKAKASAASRKKTHSHTG
jgi:serine-type D-Ala-D-Ala carboxypeptidase/endopeptidase (penicillin-binding protein 4)